jgi:glycosyltransferase involved in cell wall biosynthesis
VAQATNRIYLAAGPVLRAQDNRRRDPSQTPTSHRPEAGASWNGSRSNRGLSVALVHDYLLVMRGAERTFAAMAAIWPEAPIYTLLYDEAGTGGVFRGRDVHTSYLQRLHVRQSGFRRLLPLFPRAAERLPVQAYDLILSSSSAFAHGVRPGPDAKHICYCHTPFRYPWFEEQGALEEASPLIRPALRRVLRRLRDWDRRVSRRVTRYVANSQSTRARIRAAWDRESALVHPPVDIDRFSIGTPADYLLVVTELVRHKRVDVALEAARRAKRRIKVVGAGPELSRLRDGFGGSAEFLGRIPDDELTELYAGALALVVPGVEEFGIAAVEAQAAGRPVVAAAAGGVLETVLPGRTGVLVPPGDVDALAHALHETPFDDFDPNVIKTNTDFFSPVAFQRRLAAEVERTLAEAGFEATAPAYRAPSKTSLGAPHSVEGGA